MFNIILEQSPKSKIGMLMGVGGMVVAVAPALGPTVGGLVGTFMPWCWIFVILLPFLFVSLVCGLKTIHQVTPTEEAYINPLHVLCLAVGFVCFVFALDRGGSAVTAVSNGDTSATTQCVIAVVLLLIAMAALLVFAWVSHRAFSLVRLTVLRSVKFRWHLLAYVLLQFVTIGYGYMIPNASQLGFGASVLAAGVVLLPGALLGAASAPVSGSLLDKFGPPDVHCHARQPACLRVQTIAAVLTVRELVSGSLHSLEESGQFGGVCAGRFLQWVGESGCWEAYQRTNSSSGWRFQDV